MPTTKPQPGTCRFCLGGRRQDDTPCSACNPSWAETSYVATSGAAVLETGSRVYALVDAIKRDWIDLKVANVAVWRTGGREAAVARVAAMEDAGADRLDIPAFLRKQAD